MNYLNRVHTHTRNTNFRTSIWFHFCQLGDKKSKYKNDLNQLNQFPWFPKLTELHDY